MAALGGWAGPGVKPFQGNHLTLLSFPRGPYDIITIKWEKRCFATYHTLLDITVSGTDTTIFATTQARVFITLEARKNPLN
jgi:hypothetical protein